jgi:spore germination cell wall hydrolase CwlJ-like protein
MIRVFIALVTATIISATSAFSEERSNYSSDDYKCLAQNIYFEAKNQSRKGQMAVAYVTLNRVKSNDYPNTICGVVKQAKVSQWHLKNTGKVVPIRHKCQFSWYCDGLSDTIRDEEAYKSALEVAGYVMMMYPVNDLTFGSTHYHAHYVNPSWSSSLLKIVTIEDHIFYK